MRGDERKNREHGYSTGWAADPFLLELRLLLFGAAGSCYAFVKLLSAKLACLLLHRDMFSAYYLYQRKNPKVRHDNLT